MNVLVTGGTGFIGSHVVRALLKREHKVAILTREQARAKYKYRWDKVEICEGDITDLDSMKRAMVGRDCVVNCVQFPNHPVEQSSKGWTYMEVDGKGTVRQMEAAKASGVSRFVYLSGAGTQEGKMQPWFVAKLMAERAIRQSGMDWTIFRPSWVYGPEDRSLNKFAAFAKFLPFVPVIGDGKNKVEPLHVDDLAALVAESLDRPEAKKREFEVGGPESLTMDTIIETMLRALRKDRILLHHPVPLMKLLSVPMQILENPPLSPSAIDFITMEEPVDHTATVEVFGKDRCRKLEAGLRSYLKA